MATLPPHGHREALNLSITSSPSKKPFMQRLAVDAFLKFLPLDVGERPFSCKAHELRSLCQPRIAQRRSCLVFQPYEHFRRALPRRNIHLSEIRTEIIVWIDK